MDQSANYARSPSLAGAGQMARVSPPSLEQRLDFLQRGVERASKLRYAPASITDRISLEPESASPGSASPPSADLSSRFGETIGYLHANLDDIERTVQRLEAALFDQKAVNPVRGLG